MTTLSPAFGARSREVSRRLKLIISAGAVALAGLAASAAPARAQSSDDLIRFLLGAAAVAVVVRAIDGSASSSRVSRGRLPHGVLPEACLETVRLNRRHVDLYHAGCLGWYGIDRLPRRCETRIPTDRGMRSYHLAQCLHEAGWRPQYASVPSRPQDHWTPPRRSHDHWSPPRHRGRDDWSSPHRRGWHDPVPPRAHRPHSGGQWHWR
jgi:hypothetical protein